MRVAGLPRGEIDVIAPPSPSPMPDVHLHWGHFPSEMWHGFVHMYARTLAVGALMVAGGGIVLAGTWRWWKDGL